MKKVKERNNMREEVLMMFEQLNEEKKEKIIALASALLQDQTEFHKDVPVSPV